MSSLALCLLSHWRNFSMRLHFQASSLLPIDANLLVQRERKRAERVKRGQAASCVCLSGCEGQFCGLHAPLSSSSERRRQRRRSERVKACRCWMREQTRRQLVCLCCLRSVEWEEQQQQQRQHKREQSWCLVLGELCLVHITT